MSLYVPASIKTSQKAEEAGTKNSLSGISRVSYVSKISFIPF
jgi:hypothetical protein